MEPSKTIKWASFGEMCFGKRESLAKLMLKISIVGFLTTTAT